MVRTRQLFLLVSQTDTGIAKLIRTCSHYPYNHVSLTLDPSLRQWYSFARYVQDAPFYSGLVREPVERFLARTGDALVRIYRVEIPVTSADRLERLLLHAGDPSCGLLYNYFDAVASVAGCQLQLPNAYTCLSFACSVLERQHLNIRSLCKDLEPLLIYEGSLSSLIPDSGVREDPYFARTGLVHGTAASINQLFHLTVRVVAHRFHIYKVHRFHRTVR